MTAVGAKRNPELGDFLQVRRARLSPIDIGLPHDGPRRVRGLRREELARLIGISVDYYTRLEQGRQLTASPSVLEAAAQAMRLTREERSHLYVLAGVAEPEAPGSDVSSQMLDPRVSRVVGALGSTPAIVTGPYMDMLHANEAARFLFAEFSGMSRNERNAVRWMLLSPVAREIYGEQWLQSATEMIGMLRIDVGRLPEDPRGSELVAGLIEESHLFEQLWSDHHVADWHIEEKVLTRPLLGGMRFFNSRLVTNGPAEQKIYIMIPEDPDRFSHALEARRYDRSADSASE